MFKKLIIFLLCLQWMALPAYTQVATSYCDRTANVAAQIATTATVITATDRPIAICGFVFIGTVAGTRAQIKFGSGATVLSPNYALGANTGFVWSVDSITWTVPAGNSVTVTAGTGDVVGHIRFGFR